MISAVTSVMYAIIGTVFLTIKTGTAMLHEIFIIPGLLLILISLIKAIIGLITALSGKVSIGLLCFSLCSILISIYGILSILK